MDKKYQIEATIEELEPKSILLRGADKYLFEKSNEKKKDDKKDENKEYWNILEADNLQESKFVGLQEKFQIAISTNELGMQHLLGYAFAERKKLKFTLEEKNEKEYTITAVSHVGT